MSRSLARVFRLATLVLVLGVAPAAADSDYATRASAPRAPAAGGRSLAILCYHDVTRDPRAPLQSVTPEFLRAQIHNAKRAGWTFVRLADVVEHRDRPERLPKKAMVLTFDDGYRSFSELALPILKDEKVPATLAIVTSFVDAPPADLPPLMSWDEIRAAEATGLVEIASHSHDLHRYETTNPWRDTAPAASTRRFRLADSRYENRDEYRARVRDDLARSQRVLTERLGHPVRTLVWPYGHHNAVARALAQEQGFATTLALGGRAVEAADRTAACLPRVMVTRNLAIPGDGAWLRPPTPALRAAQVDIDPLWDRDAARFRANVDRMIARVRAAGATHVILQACPDPNGDGKLREAWFMNHQVPVRGDAWSMIAAKLQQVRLRTWIRAPVMNLAWAWERHPEWRIPFEPVAGASREPWAFRVSPDLPDARRAAIDFYNDLAVYLPVEGVLFDDDAFMLPGETLAGSGRADPAAKSAAMRALIEELKATVRAWRPDCRFGRNLYAPVVDHAGVDPGSSQGLRETLEHDDVAVVMAYAHMEGHAADADVWIGRLVRRALARASGIEPRGTPAPILFKLQAHDWTTERWLDGETLLGQARAAKNAGAVHLGVYPVALDHGDLPDRLLEGSPAPVAGAAAK